VVSQLPGTNFGALQVLEDANCPFLLLRGAAQGMNATLMIGVAAMRKIKPRHVHAQPQELA
jgi:hypothetical protein